jgi:hypothetical protein
MKIQLNLKEDQEIRKEVREIIIEQVTGIVRSEFHEIIKEEVVRIINANMNKPECNTPIYLTIEKLAAKEFNRQWLRENKYEKMIKEHIDEIIEHDRKTIFPNREEIEKIVKDKIMKQLLNN